MRLKFISAEQLLEMMENGDKFKLVEVLSKESYEKGHISGAINMPVDKIESLAPKMLKKSDIIVVYCASYQCHASTNAARMLIKMGYKRVMDYKAGKQGWIDSGFELAK